jgi:hypothetical protein
MRGNLIYIWDACSLAQTKGLSTLIYHKPALEVRFVRGAAGTTSFFTIREAIRCSWQIAGLLPPNFGLSAVTLNVPGGDHKYCNG